MIEREKLQHLIENIGIPKLCLILLLGISLIIVSIPSGKTKKNAQSTETTAKEDSTDLYVKKQERRLVNALKHVEGVGKVKVMITVNSSKEAVVNKDSPYEQSSSEKEKTVKEEEQTVLIEEDGKCHSICFQQNMNMVWFSIDLQYMKASLICNVTDPFINSITDSVN